MLTLSGVHTFYGHIEALKGIDVDVKKGEIVTLIGSNGAGKSTLLMTICGSPQARMGTVMFDGRDITRMPTHMITRAGISQSPEGRRIFPRMTVLENLQMGALLGDPAHFPQDLEMALDLFPILRARQAQRGGTLSGGEQQMLAIARALMLKPRLMLLDEPSFGLAPLIVVEIFRILRRINEDEKVSILLVEQNAALALDLATHAYVLETGRVVMSGPSAVIKDDENVRKSYLGY